MITNAEEKIEKRYLKDVWIKKIFQEKARVKILKERWLENPRTIEEDKFFQFKPNWTVKLVEEKLNEFLLILPIDQFNLAIEDDIKVDETGFKIAPREHQSLFVSLRLYYEKKILNKCSWDKTFRKRLNEKPTETLQDYLKTEFPEHIMIKIIWEFENELYLTLPYSLFHYPCVCEEELDFVALGYASTNVDKFRIGRPYGRELLGRQIYC